MGSAAWLLLAVCMIQALSLAAGVSYLGCFIDNAHRDLPLPHNAGHKATKGYCWKYCRNAGYKYFALQYYSYCFCGNTYGRYGRSSESQCSLKCLGDRSTNCGGAWRNSIYTTGLSSKRFSTPGMKHLGCFVDAATRDLPKLAGTGSMTVGKCYGLCKNLGYKFFGVQFSKECWCGNHYGRYGRHDKKECRMQCSGDKTTYCGSNWRNDIFTTGVGAVSAATHGVNYLGCYVDNANRDLPLPHNAGHKATKEYCWKYCRNAGYKYFALQYYSYCFCGNTYGRFGRAAEKDCSLKCLGDKRTNCGGGWRNSIYTTGLSSKRIGSTPGMKHLGCFLDAATRDMPKLAETGSMTVERCYGLCNNLRYKFFGVQNKDECWCGNHYGRYGLRDKKECRMQCTGDKTTYCGSTWRNDIFTTGVGVATSEVRYLGCFIDNANRDLPLPHNAGHKATKEYCWKYCRNAGYKYFALQYYSYCFCGNTYGRYGLTAEKDCSLKCYGDKTTNCGGAWRNNVYTTGLSSTRIETPGMKDLGCFVDAATRDLPKLAGTGSMTIGKCYGLCKNLGYKFFGVQFSKECWCGNHYGRYGRHDKKECRMQCSGDKTTYCGAGWRNNIFTTGVGVATSTSGVNYLGCYVDNAHRDLPLPHNAGHKATKEYCWKYCRNAGYKYFALQYYSYCFCGNAYGRFGRAAEKDCSLKCLGDKRTNCGGAWRNSIYTTGLSSKRTGGLKHLGCFIDSASRDLPKLAATGSMTVLVCNEKCKKLGYRFFGVQFATECWCGNTYGKLGSTSQTDCRMQCTGDKAAYCGASWRNDIFTVGAVTPTQQKVQAPKCPTGTEETSVPHRTCTCKPESGQQKLGSLVFVIDTTGSMGDVIQSVKDNIKKILAANTRFQDYVIATFGDPYEKHLKKTTSASKVTSFLDDLRPSGGGDCPEFALSGALDAAKAAKKNSVMVLFTDASAKDKEKVDDVAAKLKAKRIRFFTVASGDLCRTSGAEYETLATATSGQFSKHSSDTNDKVMEFIKLGVSGKMSFSAFPADNDGLNDALKGKCPCRYVKRRACVKPHTGFLGCYRDDDSNPELAVVGSTGKMTIWKCNSLCKAKKFDYFGLKNGNICGCGNQYGNSGHVASAKCNVACNGNVGEKCGGSVYNGVYEVK